jgi:hypothetical protein
METDCTHLKRQMELLTLDLERLNKLIYKETTNKTTLQRNNLLSESDFVRELKVCLISHFSSLIFYKKTLGSGKRGHADGRTINRNTKRTRKSFSKSC